MKIGKSTNYMDFMMSVSKNMDLNKYGKCSQKSSNIFQYLQLLKIKFSVCMEDFHLKLIHLIRLEISTEFRIFHTMELCVIFYGQIQRMKGELGSVHLLEGLDTAGVRTLLTNSITKTTWKWSAEPISWLWTATTMHITKSA